LLILQIGLDNLSTDASLLSSIAIIFGTIFVVFEVKDNRRMADASAEQAKLTNLQLRQNHELSTVDLITNIYDFANSLEVQRSWLTVIRTRVSSIGEVEKLPEEKQLAFHQIASLFESIGLLVEKGYVSPELVDDMFATKLAWDTLKPFVEGMRKEFATEDYYVWFEKLYNRLGGIRPTRSSSPSAAAEREKPPLASLTNRKEEETDRTTIHPIG
jgi:hypothetical protein